jgi:hypothetical protein
MRFSTDNDETLIKVELENAENFVLIKLDGIAVLQIDENGVYIYEDSQTMEKYGFPMNKGLIKVKPYG